MAQPSVSMPDDVLDEVDDRRHSRTSRSEWIREAIQARIALEDADRWDDTVAGDDLSAEA